MSAVDVAATDRLDAPAADAVPSEPNATPRPRSGGPRTPEGKERSRRNALKHGLRAKVLMPDDLAELLETRTTQFLEEFAPASAYEEWLVEEIARATVQIDRCHALKQADNQRVIDRAQRFWEMDRRLEIEDIGVRIKKDPARVAQALLKSKQGADWLMERWTGLGQIARNVGDWTEEQRRLALGVPLEIREGNPILPTANDLDAFTALVDDQMDLLGTLRALVLDERDARDREQAIAGIPVGEDATSARLRRYEAGCRRALHWARTELRRVREEASKLEDENTPEYPHQMSQAAANYQARRFEASLSRSPDDPVAPLSHPPSSINHSSSTIPASATPGGPSADFEAVLAEVMATPQRDEVRARKSATAPPTAPTAQTGPVEPMDVRCSALPEYDPRVEDVETWGKRVIRESVRSLVFGPSPR